MSKKNRKLSYFAVLALTFAPYFLAPSKFRPLRFVVSHSAEPPKQFFVLLRKKSRKMARGLEEALDSLQKACFAFTPFSSLIKPSAKRRRIALARRVLQIAAGAKKWLFEIRLPRGDAPSRPRALRRPLSENPVFRRNILPDELQFVLESISSYACFKLR